MVLSSSSQEWSIGEAKHGEVLKYEAALEWQLNDITKEEHRELIGAEDVSPLVFKTESSQ